MSGSRILVLLLIVKFRYQCIEAYPLTLFGICFALIADYPMADGDRTADVGPAMAMKTDPKGRGIHVY
jgi:hypothetical protein